MFTLSKLAAAALWLPLLVNAQPTEPQTSVKLNLPADSPVALVSADWGESRAAARGGATLLDVRTSLSLRNTSGRRIRGVTLLVQAQSFTPGGKASVSVPGMDIAPGENFPVRVDVRLLRPLQSGRDSGVSVELDGVLFDDLSFYGPDRLNSRRAMTVWELEARRDRKHYLAVFESGGAEAVRQELLAALAREAQRPHADVRMGRDHATNAAAERQVEIAFLQLPDAPIELLQGVTRVAGNEARTRSITVRNSSPSPVTHLQLGWIFRDKQGREYGGGAAPSTVSLAPGARSTVVQEASMRLSEGPGQPLFIDGVTGYLASVEFGDGRFWVPPRGALTSDRLRRAVPPSVEEQRLTELYRKRGLASVIEELKKH